MDVSVMAILWDNVDPQCPYIQPRRFPALPPPTFVICFAELCN